MSLAPGAPGLLAPAALSPLTTTFSARESREVQGLLKVLSSPWLIDQLASVPGYEPSHCAERFS